MTRSRSWWHKQGRQAAPVLLGQKTRSAEVAAGEGGRGGMNTTAAPYPRTIHITFLPVEVPEPEHNTPTIDKLQTAEGETSKNNLRWMMTDDD